MIHPLQLLKDAKRQKIVPKKSLGQSFLIDPLVIEFIVDQFSKDDTVLEIGPGLGIVTFPLSDKVKELWSIEKDHRMIKFLNLQATRYTLHATGLRVVPGDYLKESFELKKNIPKPYKIFGNIPYYITNSIIQDIIQTPSDIAPTETILMLQKEVAERVTGKKGSVGLLTILVELSCKTELLAHVPKRSFTPQPNVDSALVRFSFGKNFGKKELLKKHEVEEKRFIHLVKHCFLGRRKKIRNTLASYLRKEPGEAEKLLTGVNIDFNKRPEDLVFDEWLQLAGFINGEK